MECPYCGSDMVGGRVWVHWPKAAAQVRWEPTDPGWDGVVSVLTRGLIRRTTRTAHFCPECDALVMAPARPRGEGPDVR